MGMELDLQVPSGKRLTGYVAAPKSGEGPGVVVLQEWWGLVPHIREICDRLAQAGFVALAPDLYHGEATKSPDAAGRLMMALDIQATAIDLHSAIRHLSGSNQERVGIIGFCMGGQLALYAASQFADIGVCVDFYGIHPKVRLDFTRIHCPVVGFFGETDPPVTPDAAKALENNLKTYGVQTDFTIFPGVGHAFFNDSRPEAYNKEAAEKAWDKTIAALRKHLKPAALR